MMGLKRRLRKEYGLGYFDGLADIPMRVGPFIGTLQESGMLNDAYARGHKDGSQERKHRQDWHSRWNKPSTPNYQAAVDILSGPRPVDSIANVPPPPQPQQRSVDPWEILEGPHD